MKRAFSFCLWLLGLALPSLALDDDHNGMSDVWEARFHARGIAAEADEDGDGESNLKESLAGTDPFDGQSGFRAEVVRDGAVVRIRITGQAGKSYQLVSASTVSGDWQPLGAAVPGNGALCEFVRPIVGDRGFFRVQVLDLDSDGDGLDDWSERQLAGFDPNQADSFGPSVSGNDLSVAAAMMLALRNGEITATASAAVAYEKESAPAVVIYSRATAAAYPTTLFLKTSGASDPTKASASQEDYQLRGPDGLGLTGPLVLPAGATAVPLSIVPITDTKPEVPEQLKFRLGGSDVVTSVSVADANPVAANRRLLVAYLGASSGVATSGSGLATLLLEGNHDLAVVSVSFSNLNSAVNSVQVVNSAASILQSIPPFAYGGQNWSIRASQNFSTDQQVLDALLSGGVRLVVYTSTQAAGEIEGTFQIASGSTEFQAPPAPEPIASLTGSELDRDLLRFLSQATFGPTPADLTMMQAKVAAKGGDRIAAYREWIDEQFALPVPSLLAYTQAANRQEIEVRAALPIDDPNYSSAFDPSSSNRRRGWWMQALHSPAQLRERLAFALSQVFVISEIDSLVSERAYGAAHYYDMLRTQAGGSYRSLLQGVSTHPMMGYYLSHLRNSKATYANGNLVTFPDENFAREIMQLFSIGLVQLHPDGSLKLASNGLPIPTYNQTDITEMARVFTGWSFSVRNSPSTSNTVISNTSFYAGNGNERYEAQWTAPMGMFASYHDTGVKSMIGLSLPANQTGEKDLADVLDYLSVHPNTAPFLCRRLIQRFVTANPSAGYLHRVATAFQNSGGSFPETMKAILLDPEARSPSKSQSLASSGKPREPLLRVTAFYRAFGAKSQLLLSDLSAYGFPAEELAKFPAGTTRARISNSTSSLGQSPLAAPTVFNWFLPDYSPPGLLAANGLYSPELQIANENTVIQANNFIYNSIFGSGPSVTGLVDQTTPPYPYTSISHQVLMDVSPLNQIYLGILDVNQDGTFTNLDVGTFNNPAKIAEACTAVVDRIDLLLCAGGLKARYGDEAGRPRKIILDAVSSIQSSGNNTNNASSQATYMRDRIRTALWLVMSSPECVIQK